MPYIKKDDRKRYDELVDKLVVALLEAGPDKDSTVMGDINYVVSSIVWKLFDKTKTYTNGNNLTGVLECVKQEFYRRKLSKYEDQKIIENGDL